MKKMKYITRIVLVGFLMLGMVALGTKTDVFAASMDILVTPTEPANAGDNVSVRLTLNNNPGITTFGASVAYDSSVLQYSGATWLSSVSAGGNMVLASDVVENGQSKVNVSAVMNDSVYSASGETFVTLNFTARQAYSSIPVSVEVRDISDANYEDVTATVVMEKGNPSSSTSTESESSSNNSESESGGNNNSESESGGNNNSESESGGNHNSEPDNGGDDGDDDGDSDGGDDDNDNDDSEQGNGTKPNKTGNKTGGSSDKTGTDGGSKNLDSTFKTGAVDPKVIFAVIAVVLAAGAGGCMYYLRRRKI